MGYPNYKGKHAERALIHPKDFVAWRAGKNARASAAPEKYVLIYYSKVLDHFIKTHKPEKIPFNRLITIHRLDDIGVVQMTGIGSPHAATVLEELIAIGGREFINVGSAGGLSEFGTVLCEKSIRDEGTSSHYAAHGKFAHPDKELTGRLERQLIARGLPYRKGASWTIDAPYRETVAEINQYRKENVLTVEMESSALFTVARFRKVKLAAAFVVSDLLAGDRWDPQFDAKHVHHSLNALFDAALACLFEK